MPTEVWIHIWSFLDFKTLQKICTLVSKRWLTDIRNSTRLSGELILRLYNQDVNDINEVLSRWPKLKVLHLSDCNCDFRLSKLVSHCKKLNEFPLDTEILGINLTEHALLRKIIVPTSMYILELGDLEKATKVWCDPKNWNPATFENVINLKLFVNSVPQCLEFQQCFFDRFFQFNTGRPCNTKKGLLQNH